MKTESEATEAGVSVALSVILSLGMDRPPGWIQRVLCRGVIRDGHIELPKQTWDELKSGKVGCAECGR